MSSPPRSWWVLCKNREVLDAEQNLKTLETRKRWQPQHSRLEKDDNLSVLDKRERHTALSEGSWEFDFLKKHFGGYFIFYGYDVFCFYIYHTSVLMETLLFTLLNITLLDNHSRRSRFLLSRTHNRLKYLRDCRPFLSALPHLNASSEIRVACHAVVDNSSREKTRKVTIDLLCLNCQTSQRTSQPARPKTRMIFRRSACRYGS